MPILDGKSLAATIRQEIAQAVGAYIDKGHRKPGLVAVLVGSNPASQSYVEAKVRDCYEVGFYSNAIKLPENTSQSELLAIVHELNTDQKIDGFIVQLPLPKEIDEHKVLEAINPNKDVDGFHPENIGRMALGLPAFLPATPAGIIEMIKRSGFKTTGKSCLVIGRSNIVGMPIGLLMGRNAEPGNCTVTVAHSRTPNLAELCKQADIVIAAIGKPEFVTGEMVKEGAVVIDVGINRVENAHSSKGYSLVGDVKFDEVAPKCHLISPVPGGVGPMTRTALLLNTLQAYKRHERLS